MAGRVILAVSDEAAVRQSLLDILSLEGHEVDGAAEAEEALLLLDQRRYDLVVSDLRMPGLDGPALWEALQQRFGETPPRLLFLTSQLFEPHYGGFLADLGAAVLVKPFSPARLLEMVGRVIQS